MVIGNYGKRTSMSATTKDYLNKFWELVDDILNAILFLFIGFELLIIKSIPSNWHIGLICIVIVLIARFVSIYIPVLLVPFRNKFSSGTIKILVWGGLRGGVSIALALSIAEGPQKKVLLAATYFVVVFSIIVQGLSIGKGGFLRALGTPVGIGAGRRILHQAIVAIAVQGDQHFRPEEHRPRCRSG